MPRNLALVVGINTYKFWTSLRYAQRDAELMGNFLRREAKFDEVCLFTDNSPEFDSYDTQPTRANLRFFLQDRFAHPFLDPADHFWFFFSGHGLRFENRDYLMPADGYGNDPEGSALSLHWILEQITRSGAGNTVVILDACRNEAKGGGSGFGQEQFKNVTTLFSCRSQEASWEIDPLKQGSFTYALLTTFQQQTDQRYFTITETEKRLRQHVRKINQHYQKPRQTPHIRCDSVSRGDQILLPQFAELAKVVPLKDRAYTAELNGNLDEADRLWQEILARTRPGDADYALAVDGIRRIAAKKAELAAQKLFQPIQPTPTPTPKPPAPAPPVAKPTPSPPPVPVTSVGTKPTPKPQPKPPAPTPPDLSDLFINRRKLLQWGGYAGGGLLLTVIGSQLMNQSSPSTDSSQTSSQPQSSSTIPEPSPIQLDPLPEGISPTSLHTLTLPRNTVRVNDRGEVIEEIPVQVNVYDEDLGNGVTLRMVEIPAGTFTMGSPNDEPGRGDDEGPQRQVTVPRFFMGMFTITQAQYAAMTGDYPSRFDGGGGSNRDNLPVETVSWNDADTFCQQLSQQTGRTYRLPSEAEWEYACRAGTTTPFNFGATITDRLVNFWATSTYGNAPEGNYRQRTTEVGSFPPNGFGLFDMHGNVWEWCADHWHDNYNGAPNDATIWSSSNETRRVLRGGCWNDYPRNCRSANRYRINPDGRSLIFGFRVVFSLPRT